MALRRCQHCGTPYHWEKSTSRYLKMTVCSTSCERRLHDGYTIEDFLALERNMAIYLLRSQARKAAEEMWARI